jgi:DNA-binding NtrC family response regulator
MEDIMFEYIILAYSDIETRSILYEILTDLGYKITTVLSHKELMEILKKERPKYIILEPAISDIPIETVLEKIKIIDEDIKIIISPFNKDKSQLTQNILKLLREQDNLSTQKETKGISIDANILVVDDEIECTRLIRNHLSKKGYNVDATSTGEEAIFKIKTHKPDIVFLDIRLPGMDGIIVLKTIKEIDKSITVIMTSAIEDGKIIQEAIKLGANGYLIKPFNMLKLEAMILSKIKISLSYQPHLF